MVVLSGVNKEYEWLIDKLLSTYWASILSPRFEDDVHKVIIPVKRLQELLENEVQTKPSPHSHVFAKSVIQWLYDDGILKASHSMQEYTDILSSIEKSIRANT